MDENITDSQPVETESVTSECESPSNDEITEEHEPESENDTAEAEEARKYAGKYNSIEELEKGYGSQTSYINELQSTIEKYELKLAEQEQRANEVKLEEAKAKGFESIEAQEIAQKVIIKEFELYAGNLAKVNPEYQEIVSEALSKYYSTADKVFLNEAKKYFPDEVIENVTEEKLNLKSTLQNELKQRTEQQQYIEKQKLCSEIENNFKDFLSDVLVDESQKVNTAKSNALSAMFNLGVIKNTDDMKAFENLYNSIAERAVNDYISAIQAQDNVNSVKKKAFVPSGSLNIPEKKPDINSKEYWENYYNK